MHREIFHNSIVLGDSSWQTFHHSIVWDDRYWYVDLSLFFCFSVKEQRCSETANRRSRYNKLVGTPVRHSSSMPHAPPAQRSSIWRCLSLLHPEKLKVDSHNKVVMTILCVR